MNREKTPVAPLEGLKVLDLSRILAGPSCTQLLGDLGADVVKVEKPGVGDDTRKWAPPYLAGEDGEPLPESAYYCAANRNKRSIEIDIAAEDGQRLIRQLLAETDILVENYKVGKLAEYGLGYEDLRDTFPRLIYCSITGFGQTGPYAGRPGYDYIAQGMGGLMSLTGEPEGEPMKVGVGISDLLCGLYAATGILASLRLRELTGRGQHLDCSLLDCQVASLANAASAYLATGDAPERLGNEHPTIVPYKAMQTSDGFVVLAVGNDEQFRKWCDFAGAAELCEDPRFRRNSDRVVHRAALYPIVAEIMKQRTSADWTEGLSRLGVPCGPVYSLDAMFDDRHVRHRGLQIAVPSRRARGGAVNLVGYPVKMSEGRVSYRHEPPALGEHNDEIVEAWLAKSPTAS